MTNYQKLTDLRKQNNLNYRQMSELLGISRTYYYQIENKQRNLSYDMAKKISKLFNQKTDDIFY